MSCFLFWKRAMRDKQERRDEQDGTRPSGRVQARAFIKEASSSPAGMVVGWR